MQNTTRRQRKKMLKNIEKHSVKISIGVAVIVILFLLRISFNFTTWKMEMENKIENVDTRQVHLASKYVGHTDRLTALEDENNDTDVQMAMITTKLANIEALLLELKERLK